MSEFKPFHVMKPWGYEKIIAQTDKYIGKILHVVEGEELSLQYHHNKDETLYVLSGQIALEIRGNVRDTLPESWFTLNMFPGDSYHIKAGEIHRISAKKTSEIMEVSTPEMDDVVRIEDKYGR